MQKALDGTLTEEERLAWQDWLQQHPGDLALYEEQALITRLLEKMPEEEPPAHLEGQIMRSIRNKQRNNHSIGQLIFQRQEDPMAPKYRWLLLGAAAVVIIAVVISRFYPSTPDSTTQGTIGAVQKADKFDSGQMSAGDVTLTDSELQQLLQNEVVQRIVADQKLMAALQTMDSKALAALQTLDGRAIEALQSLDGRAIAAMQTLDARSIAALQTLDGKAIAALQTLDAKSIAALQTVDAKSIPALQALDGKAIAALQSMDGKAIAALQTLDVKAIGALQSLDARSIAALHSLDARTIASMQTAEGKATVE